MNKWSYRQTLLGKFSKFYDIQLEDVKKQLKEFKNFKQFFIRQLKDKTRPIQEFQNQDAMSCPCDGTVYVFGEVKDNKIECVKGHTYPLEEFIFGSKMPNSNESEYLSMINDKIKQRNHKLFYTVLYLSPKNYHRYHSPCAFQVHFRRHIVGFLQLVRPSYVSKHKDVFKNNERVNLFGSWKQGFFLFSAVGALNVGSININFDKKLQTNKSLFRQKNKQFYDKQFSKTQNYLIQEANTSIPELFSHLQKNPKNSSSIHLKDQDFDQFDVNDIVTANDIKEQNGKFKRPYSSLMQMYLRYNACNNFTQDFDEGIRDQNNSGQYSAVQEYITNTEKYKLNQNGVLLQKGEEIGYFNFGSTVVLIFQAPENFQFNSKIQEGSQIKVGQLFGEVRK